MNSIKPRLTSPGYTGRTLERVLYGMSESSWLPIRYRDFYDLPRLVAVEFQGSVYLFDAPFNESAGQYSAEFTVYRLPAKLSAQLDEPSWRGLTALGEKVGRVPTESVKFDPTRRRFIKDSVFRQLDIAG